MRIAVLILLLGSFAFAQDPKLSTRPEPAPPPPPEPKPKNELIIPSGTKVPVALKHAISTKVAHEGDSVYAETSFPVVLNDRVLIPAGTYVQGKISRVQRAGRIKGKAEVLIHFTTLIYPSGYTVIMPGAVENAPGIDKAAVKDQEGTIKGDGQTGEKVGTIASTAATGTVIGGLSQGGKGALIGAGIGGAAGTAIAMLTRGNDVKLDAGTTLEMVIQRDIPLDPSRVPTTTGRQASNN